MYVAAIPILCLCTSLGCYVYSKRIRSDKCYNVSECSRNNCLSSPFYMFQGIRVLSPETISFHYMDPAHMFMYDFLLYDLTRHET